MVAGLCVVVAAFPMDVKTDEVYEVLKAKEIEIAGDNGRTLLTLGTTENGGFAQFFNDDGEAATVLDGGGVATFDDDG